MKTETLDIAATLTAAIIASQPELIDREHRDKAAKDAITIYRLVKAELSRQPAPAASKPRGVGAIASRRG